MEFKNDNISTKSSPYKYTDAGYCGVTHVVMEVKGFPHFRESYCKGCIHKCNSINFDIWHVQVLSYCCGIIKKTYLCFDTREEALKVQEGYTFTHKAK